MLTGDFPTSSEKDTLSGTIENQWYDQDKLLRLVHTSEKKVPCLQYVFASSGDAEDPYLTFMNQFSNLKKLKDKLGYKTYFISMQPGSVSSQHFIFGMILDKKLIIINPMGDSTREDFYKIIFKIKDDLNYIDSVYISNTQIQKDEKAIISCGPICVELFNYFTSPEGVEALQLMITKDIREKRKELKYSKEEVRKYTLKNPKKDQNETLNYISIDIASFLSEDLKRLLICDPEKYKEQLNEIRKNHTHVQVTGNIWTSEQSLIFKMLENPKLEIEKQSEFLELQKLKSLSGREEKESETKSPEELLYTSNLQDESHERLGERHATSRNLPKEEIKISEEAFNRRWDRTSELQADKANKWKLKLDSIARLIEGGSTCAAITIEEDSFLIATNKNFPSNSTDQGYVLIQTVMSYLKKVATVDTEQEIESDFKEAVIKICREAMSGLQVPLHIKDKLLENAFIERVMEASNKGQPDYTGLRDCISEMAEYGHVPGNEGSAFVVCVALMRDLKKTRNFIRKNKDVTGDSETARFIKAIKGYNKSNIIDNSKLALKIHDENTRIGMHAEMRILSLIEDKLKARDVSYKNYIGISKLCCLDCHAMIHAVKLAEGYNNNVEIRGAHNVRNNKNWEPPFNITGNSSKQLNPPPISGGRAGRAAPRDPFAAIVAENFNAVRTGKASISGYDAKGKPIMGATSVSEYPNLSQSSSDEEMEDYYEKYRSYLAHMKKTLEMRRGICRVPNSELLHEIKVLEVGLKICTEKAFKVICRTEFDDLSSRASRVGQSSFQALLSAVNRDKGEDKLLVEFLKSPMHAGEKVSTYFSGVDLNLSLLSESQYKPDPNLKRKDPGST